MHIGSRRTKFAVAVTIAWLAVLALATRGSEIRAAVASSSPVNETAAPHSVFNPACGTSAAYTQSAAGQAAAPAQGSQMSDTAFKNVTALKGIPVDEFMGTMGLFSAALGMCCLECHNEDWTFDTPRKKRARAMILMTDALNKANFNGRKVVTCWTCHRQSDRPYTTPPLDVIYGEPIFYQPDDLFQQAQGAPKPDEVLDKYIQAVGGAQRVAALTSLVGKGTGSGFAGSLRSPAEVYAKAPNQRTTFIHTDDGDKTMTYDGRSGWLASNVTPVPVMTLTGGELDGARLDAELMFPGRIKQVLTQWRAALPMTLNGRSVNVLQGTGKEMTATLYFDAQTGLLTRVVRYANSAMGRVPTQIDLDDYREVAGVKVPYKWSFAWTSGRDLYELTEVQANVAVDAAKFSKPLPAKSKIR
jgi:photosynthetic reaction center cytochrome c subunit